MAAVCFASFSSLRLRASPRMNTSSGTMFVAVPPWITPDVRGRLFIDATERHGRDLPRWPRDGVDAPLRLAAGVRLAAVDCDAQAILARCADHDVVERSTPIEDDTAARADLALI